jgi:hypothetical protein
MPRTSRATFGGVVYHVLNRSNGRLEIFRRPGDYAAFIKILEEGRQRTGMRILAYCLMGNHYESQEVDTREDPEDLRGAGRAAHATAAARRGGLSQCIGRPGRDGGIQIERGTRIGVNGFGAAGGG